MSPRRKLTLQQMRDEAARKLADFEARIRQNQGVPIDDDEQLVPSSTENRYHRETRPLRWSIHCVLCERENVIATRYPGQTPRICDECYTQFTDDEAGRQKSRNDAKKAELERAKAGKPARREAKRLRDEAE